MKATPKFACPTCRAEYDWTPELAGQKCQCAKCGHKFIVGSLGGVNAPGAVPVISGSGLAPVASARRNNAGVLGVAAALAVVAAVAFGLWWHWKGLPGAGEGGVSASAKEAKHPGASMVLRETPPPRRRDAGFLYSGKDLGGIEAIAEAAEKAREPWRKEAEARIEKFRMGDMKLRVLDAQGRPVEGAAVRVVLRKHKFRFGCAVSAPGMFVPKSEAKGRNKKRYESHMQSAAMHRAVFLNMGFNSAGFNNSLKYKFRKNREPYLPMAFDWFRRHGIAVRGHCLIWPGTKHLPSDLASLVAAGDKPAIRKYCRKMIAEWASKWNVIEWDVINEPRNNHIIQDILGPEAMVEWFKIAKKNAPNPDCRFDLNENRVISDPAPGVVTKDMKIYRSQVEFLLAHGAPVNSLAFQSRFGRMNDAVEIYQRLCWFEDFGFPITATEFEIKNSIQSEFDRARMTERVMTVYFSHRLVDGILAWSLFPTGDGREIVDASGRPNLRGKVWLYLMKNRWTTDLSLHTDAQGTVSVRAFKGDYDIKVSRDGKTKHYRVSLDAPLSAEIVW